MNNITKENIQLKSKYSINLSCLLVTTPFTNPEVMFPPVPQKREKELAPGDFKGRGGKWGKNTQNFFRFLLCTCQIQTLHLEGDEVKVFYYHTTPE